MPPELIGESATNSEVNESIGTRSSENIAAGTLRSGERVRTLGNAQLDFDGGRAPIGGPYDT